MTGFFLIRGKDPQGTERIELGATTLVGRSEECDLRVSEGHPSRRHATLTVDARGLWVEDLGSANGTRVNGHPITAKTLLARGDLVAFDLETFVVECPAAPPAAASADATVVRRAPAADATVVRAPPPAAPPTGQAAVGGPRSEAEALQKQVPRSWADPEYQGAGTRILSPEEMRALAAGGGAAAASGDAPAPMHVEGPHLVILAGPGAGRAFPLGGSDSEWSIGTAPERDVRLDFPGVSAFHAKLSQEGGRWRIIDQMSANGTWVNGQKSTISYLQNGDKLRFAQVECEFRLPADTGAGRRAAADRGSSGGLRTVLIALGVAVATGVALYVASRFL
jgi:pSer/pThr/pTyr-binding forkhead associated (FHA) protein